MFDAGAGVAVADPERNAEAQKQHETQKERPL